MSESSDEKRETMSDEDKVGKSLYFYGTKDEWIMWEEKMLAYAYRKGFDALFDLKSSDVPEEHEDPTKRKQLTAEETKIVDWNKQAYSVLANNIQASTEAGRTAFQVLRGTKTPEYSKGNAVLAWERLRNKYAPRTAPTLIALNKEFVNSKPEGAEADPDVWLTKLEGIRTRMKEIDPTVAPTKKALLLHITGYRPAGYDIEVAQIEELMEGKEEDIDIKTVRTKLNLCYKKIQKADGIKDKLVSGPKTEHALLKI